MHNVIWNDRVAANSLLLAWWAETPLEISNKQIFHTVSSIWFMWDQQNMNTANTVWNAFKSHNTPASNVLTHIKAEPEFTIRASASKLERGVTERPQLSIHRLQTAPPSLATTSKPHMTERVTSETCGQLLQKSTVLRCPTSELLHLSPNTPPKRCQ